MTAKMSSRIAKISVAVAAGAALTAAALHPGLAAHPASSASPAPTAAATAGAADTPSNARADTGETVAALRKAVSSGRLLDSHGVRSVCPRCHSEVVTDHKGSSSPLRSALPAGYGPADLDKAYRLPGTSTGKGIIAVVNAGVDPALEEDLAAYRRTYHLPPCTTASGCLRLLDYTGGAQPAPRDPKKDPHGAFVEEEVSLETSLDLDMASAACPSCRLMEISVPWQDAEDDNDVSTGDFARAVNTAVAHHASAVSISYGYSADVTNTSGGLLAALRHKGVAITASTGDSGFNGGIHQSWPSDLPSVISVGGVTLPATGPATAWWSGGSGCETRFPAAHGQPSSVTGACGGHRAAADVSADADAATGVAVYDTYAPSTGEPYNWVIAGGTSASAPYIAGLFVRAGHLAPVDGPRTLYRAPAAAFTDITAGNNETYHLCADYPGLSTSVCSAGKGWDGPTGLGMPHGLAAF
ncbi:S8 family serine peptidase [Streptomyces sp. MI02-7b]|uniref:S8 family serine peptidase n=2 Tax=unclassified Streptomyces TaxID=2593676 RepID=UPI0029CA70FD|nr:S8 family serine peptidase [Streptomyces sp. MI02-7b]